MIIVDQHLELFAVSFDLYIDHTLTRQEVMDGPYLLLHVRVAETSEPMRIGVRLTQERRFRWSSMIGQRYYFETQNSKAIQRYQ